MMHIAVLGGARSSEFQISALSDELGTSYPLAKVSTGQFPDEVSSWALSCRVDVIVATGVDSKQLVELDTLTCSVVWDMKDVTSDDIVDAFQDEANLSTFKRGLAATDAFANVTEVTALLIEDELSVGLSTHSVSECVAGVIEPVAITIGTGMGNMIYATPMIRWISEKLGKPITLIINDRFDPAVSLFSRSRFVNRVYPGFEYVVGKHFADYVSSVTAGAMRPPVTADRFHAVDQAISYNEEGRYIHETELNFLGLTAFPVDMPQSNSEIPDPFIRDLAHNPIGERVIGVANGHKSAAWAKREWGGMHQAVQNLVEEGWQVRSFGLADEYVEGSSNYTAIPLRDALTAISECDLFLSHDGGIAHMAEALGVPTVWLFGPTGSIKNGPVFAHSPVLLSGRGCGPCLYKSDWLDNDQSFCMSEISVTEVLETIRNIAASGCLSSSLKRSPSVDLLEYEIDAVRRPGPIHDNELLRRTREVPYGPANFPLTLAVRLYCLGDFQGATDLLRTHALGAGGSLFERFLVELGTVFYDGPTPADGGQPLGWPPLRSEDFPRLVEELSQLPLSDRRRVLQLALRFTRLDRNFDHGVLLSTMASSDAFSVGLDRLMDYVAERFVSPIRSSAGDEIDVTTSALRGSGWLEGTSALRVKEYLMEMATVQSSLSGAPMSSSLLQGAVPDGLLTNRVTSVRLETRNGCHELPHLSTVLLVVPHVKLKHSLPGTASALVQFYARRLAMLGLRPVVATMGLGDVPSGWEIRDSVAYMQADPRWSDSQWADLISYYEPSLIMEFGAAAEMRQNELPALPSREWINTDGLQDELGLVTLMPTSEQWDAPPLSPSGNSWGDQLTQQLSVVPKTDLDYRSTSSSKVVVLLLDARDMKTIEKIAAILPGISMTVLSHAKYRGIYKNLTVVEPTSESLKEFDDTYVFVQYSSRPVTYSAELIRWLELGGRAVANVSATLDSEALYTVAEGSNFLQWSTSIRFALSARSEQDHG